MFGKKTNTHTPKRVLKLLRSRHFPDFPAVKTSLCDAGTWVWSPVWKIPHATKSANHNYWAPGIQTTSEPVSHSYWNPHSLEPTRHNYRICAPQQRPWITQLRKTQRSQINIFLNRRSTGKLSEIAMSFEMFRKTEEKQVHAEFPEKSMRLSHPKLKALGFPGGSDGKESNLQCGRPGFISWVGKIP